MKIVNIFALVFFMFAATHTLFAQQPINSNTQKPVLLYDGFPTKMKTAIASIINGNGTITTSIDDLTEKQKKKIVKYENCRDKRLRRIDTNIAKQNAKIKSGAISAKVQKKTEKRIINLLINRQQITAKTKKRILNQLSADQKKAAGLSNL
ncbi:MAG: hypothetical protein JXR27_11065 [Paludibacteraceae bacterium]|nr:hypothetical protein [Paludibacteraceae bacterium]